MARTAKGHPIDVPSGDESEGPMDDVVASHTPSKGKAKEKAPAAKAISTSSATSKASAPRASTTVKPALKQPRPTAKPTAEPPAGQEGENEEDPAEDVAEGSKGRVSVQQKRLQRENETLKKEVKALNAELATVRARAIDYQKKWEETTKKVVEQVDPAPLHARIGDLEAHLEESNRSRAHLARSLKIFDSMEKPGTLGFLTSDQARKEREGVEKKVEELRARLAESENTAASALKEELARHEGAKQQLVTQMEDLTEQLTGAKSEVETLRHDLAQEIAMHKAASSAKAGSGMRLPNGLVGDAGAMTFRLYEDLTNFLVLSATSERDPDTGLQQWFFKCMCTGAESDQGPPRSLQFTLRLFHDPAAEGVEKQKQGELNQCKFVPLELARETDQQLIRQLDFLGGPFTFAKTQLAIFFRTLSDRLKAQVEGGEADETMDASLEDEGEDEPTGGPGAPITLDD